MPLEPSYIAPLTSNSPAADMGDIETRDVLDGSTIDPNDPLNDPKGKKLFTYETIKKRLKVLVDDWETKVGYRATINRNIRNVEVDLNALHNAGELRPDETFIPIRVVNENIRQDLPPFIRYFISSHRLFIFNCTTDPNENTEELEEQVTKGMRYNNWEKAPYKNLDGAKLHGWSSLKTEYDESRPLHVNIHYVKHESLIFDTESVDFEANEIILEEHFVTLLQLDDFVNKFGFDADQVKKIKQSKEDNEIKLQEPFKIHEVYFKYQGIVYVSWACMEQGMCSDWLKKPNKFSLDIKIKETVMVQQPGPIPGTMDSFGMPLMGMMTVPQEQWKDVDETSYPYEILFKDETEDSLLISHKGQAWEDQSKQEAQTALISLYINGAVRASNVYGSPKGNTNSGAPIKKLELSLDPGCFYSEPIEFWSTEYPSPEILRASNMLDVRMQSERGKTADTVINRDDSRKTSKEIDVADQHQDDNESISLVMYAAFWRNMASRSWRIIQSQALQEKITLLQVPASQDPMTGQPVYKNDLVRLGKSYEVFPAGDIDVLEREKDLKRMAEFYPIVAPVPVLGLTFLLDMLKAAFPKDIAKYSMIIGPMIQVQQMQFQQQLMSGMMNPSPDGKALDGVNSGGQPPPKQGPPK